MGAPEHVRDGVTGNGSGEPEPAAERELTPSERPATRG